LIYYLFNPRDIIPDSVEIFGYLDDFSITGALIVWIIQKFFGGFRDRVERDYIEIVSQ
jgi:uncharacterized membrane protein YkvA (DUF1232 family)